MDDTLEAPKSARWPWILWSLTTATLFSLAWAADMFISRTTTFYVQMEFKTLPLAAELVLKWRNIVPVWLPVVAAAVSGIPFARRGDAEKTQRWALVVILLALMVGAAIVYALLDAAVVTLSSK